MEAAFYHYTGDPLSQAAVKAVYGGQLTGGVTMLEKYAAVLSTFSFLRASSEGEKDLSGTGTGHRYDFSSGN